MPLQALWGDSVTQLTKSSVLTSSAYPKIPSTSMRADSMVAPLGMSMPALAFVAASLNVTVTLSTPPEKSVMAWVLAEATGDDVDSTIRPRSTTTASTDALLPRTAPELMAAPMSIVATGLILLSLEVTNGPSWHVSKSSPTFIYNSRDKDRKRPRDGHTE